MAVTVDEKVLIQFQADMAKFKRDMSQVKNEAKSTSLGIGTAIKGALAGIGLTAITKQFIDIGDQWTSINNKIKLVSDSTKEYTTAQRELLELSQETYTDLESTASLYQRLAVATNDLGTSQEDLFTVTDVVNKSLVISGASAAEVNSVITQLGQGLAAGALRGEEFNSVVENGNRVASALSDSLGVTIGDLRKMASEGKLTSEVVTKALIDQADAIDTEFKGMTITVDQASTNVQNSFGNIVNMFNQSINGTGGIASLLQDFSKYLDKNAEDIVDFAEDIMAVGTLVKNGFESILLVSLQGYLKLTLAFKGQIESVINGILETVEKSLNYIIDAINEASKYWGDALGFDLGQMGRIDIGEVSIGTDQAMKAIEGVDIRLKELSDSTDKAIKEIVTDGVEKPIVEITKAQEKVIANTSKMVIGQKEVNKEIKKTEDKVGDLTKKVSEDLASSMSYAISGWITGMNSFKDVTQSVLQSIVDKFTELAVLSPFESFISGMFGKGGGLDLSGLVGGLFGGGTSDILGMFADGGNVYQSGNYVVGERGPEVVNLPAGSSVTPNHALGGTNVNVNVQNYSSGEVDVRQRGDDIDIIISSIASGIQRGTSPIGDSIQSRYGLRKV